LIVLDASVAVARLLAETGPIVRATMAHLETGPATVPVLWHFEVRNALLVAARRGRLEKTEIRARLRALAEIRTITDRDPDLDSALSFAERRNLSFYDALYLELATRRGAPLATLDQALLRAARSENVPVVAAPADRATEV
jgi:predicted nucleic acid-binding protein